MDLFQFGGTILATVFEEQSEKWESLVVLHTSNAIALVHDYISQLLIEICPEKQVREQLWDALLIDRLSDAYDAAMKHARFLLAIERGGRPTTFNHYFNSNLQKKRSERVTKPLKTMAVSIPNYVGQYVSVANINQHAVNKDNKQQICEDILDTLVSYYKVSRKRFVDVICQHVVYHFLLEGDQSPLKILSSDLVMGLTHEQLAAIAGEDEESKSQRQVLEREIKSLESASKVLRA